MYARRMEITATFAEEEFNKKKEQFMEAVAEERRQLIRKRQTEDTDILQVLLREILMPFQEYIKNLLTRLKRLLLAERQRGINNARKDIIV